MILVIIEIRYFKCVYLKNVYTNAFTSIDPKASRINLHRACAEVCSL